MSGRMDHFDIKLPLRSLSDMQRIVYDALIIGTGAGGGAALLRLCENWKGLAKKIGILEAGELIFPTHVYNIPDQKNNWEKLFRHHVFPIGKSLPQFPGAEQIFAVGGRTLYWGLVCPRFHDSEFKDWPLSPIEMASYYKIAEYHLGTQSGDMMKSPQQKTILERLRTSGFAESDEIPQAISPSPTGAFSSLHFLTKAMRYQSFDLAIKARAIRFHQEKGAFLVEAASGPQNMITIQAKNVILATGALETPRLLLHSGVQGNAIGRYLINHSFLRAHGTVDAKVSGNVKILIPSRPWRPYQIQLYQNTKNVNLVAFGRVQPRFENQLQLDTRTLDDYGIPQIRIDFSYSEQDRRVMSQMQDAVHRIFTIMDPERYVRKNRKVTIEWQEPGSDYHESGTCRIGTDPATSAANPYGQIHSVPGLYVVDNSALPSIGSANPTLTTIALAIRTADYISKH
jgi:choline dehydrogenase-like flavoprotein